VGEREQCTGDELRAMMGVIYGNIPMNPREKIINSVLSELTEGGLIKIDYTNQVTLAEKGRFEYISIDQERQEGLEVKKAKKEAKKAGKQNKVTSRQTELSQIPEEEMKVAYERMHEVLKGSLAQLGSMLGMRTRLEHKLTKDAPVKLDVVWYSKLSSGIGHAFEVQHRGDWKNAVGNLEAVGRHFPNCKLFLVVIGEEDIKSIRALLGGRRLKSMIVLT
jgi:hypothetical protein